MAIDRAGELAAPGPGSLPETEGLPEEFGTTLAARLLGVTRPTVRTMCRRGDLPYRRRRDGDFRFSRRTWVAWFERAYLPITPTTETRREGTKHGRPSHS